MWHWSQGQPGEPELLTWAPQEFLERFARIIPPPRHHLVRYSGALGPRSRLRPLVTRAAREAVPTEALLRGWRLGPRVLAAVGAALRSAARAAGAATRSWAATLRRVFEVDPSKGFTPRGAISMRDLFQVAQSPLDFGTWTYFWTPLVRRSVMADDFVYSVSDAGLRVANIADLSRPIATAYFQRYLTKY